MRVVHAARLRGLEAIRVEITLHACACQMLASTINNKGEAELWLHRIGEPARLLAYANRNGTRNLYKET
jgi:hypothetical protein